MKILALMVILLLYNTLACNLTDTERITLQDLELDGDSGNISEKYQKGIPLTQEEQEYFAVSYEKAIKQKINDVMKAKKACHAIGGCGSTSFVLRDILEDNKEVYLSVAERETFKIKSDYPSGRFACEPAIFDTLDGYDVTYNGNVFAEQTKQAIRNIDRKWYLRKDLKSIKTEFNKRINDEEDLSRMFLKRGQIDAGQLHQEILNLKDKEGLIIFLEDRKLLDETSQVSKNQLDHTLYIQRNQDHFFLIEPLHSNGRFNTSYRSIHQILERPEDLTSFLHEKFNESILTKQSELRLAIHDLGRLEEQLNEPIALEQLHALNKQINRIEYLKDILRNRGLEDPLAPFMYEAKFRTTSRSK